MFGFTFHGVLQGAKRRILGQWSALTRLIKDRWMLEELVVECDFNHGNSAPASLDRVVVAGKSDDLQSAQFHCQDIAEDFVVVMALV